jgi:23S rRNA pseudouridine1911/1915/1917 synthase
VSVPGELEEPAALEVEVPALLDGVRLDRALSMLTGLTRAASAALVADGAVAVDGVTSAKGSLVLRAGQRLDAALPEVTADALVPEPDVAFEVLVEDAAFVVVDKPPGLVVHPGAGHRTGTLVAGLLARYPDLSSMVGAAGTDPLRPGVVQRLDRGTSGVLVIARTTDALASLGGQLAHRAMERVYTGLVEGHVDDARGVIDAPIGRSQRTPTKMAVRASGRPAQTAYEVTERMERPARTLLELRLTTGRTHQIRVHVAAIGRPIVNDPRYGRHREPALAEGRVFLHAATLGFDHPVTGARVRVESPLPADLAALLARSR